MGNQNNVQWFRKFEKRMQQEIEFSQVYAQNFGHGTDGHNGKLIIAKMAEELNSVYTALNAQAYELDMANERAREWEAKVKGA